MERVEFFERDLNNNNWPLLVERRSKCEVKQWGLQCSCQWHVLPTTHRAFAANRTGDLALSCRDGGGGAGTRKGPLAAARNVVAVGGKQFRSYHQCASCLNSELTDRQLAR